MQIADREPTRRIIDIFSTGDDEADAIAVCTLALRDLNEEGRARVIEFIRDRYVVVHADIVDPDISEAHAKLDTLATQQRRRPHALRRPDLLEGEDDL